MGLVRLAVLACAWQPALASLNVYVKQALHLPPSGFHDVPTSHFQFAYSGGRPFIKMGKMHELEDRGVMTRLALLLASRRYTGPEFFFGFDADDRPYSQPTQPRLSYSRAAGASSPLLVPDHDVWGWTTYWVPPTDAFAAEAAFAPAWAERRDSVHWSGVNRTKERALLARCALRTPGFDVHTFIWDGRMLAAAGAPTCMLTDLDMMRITCRRDKPPVLDDRRLLQHRYLVYLPGIGWSSLMKRLLMSGAVILAPRQPAAESLATLWAAERGLTVSFDAEDPCTSISRSLAHLNATRAAARAAHFAAAARVHFGRAASERYLRLLFRALATRQSGVPPPDALLALGYQELTCEWVQRDATRRLRDIMAWQLGAWYDNVTCLPRPLAPRSGPL